MKVGDKVRMTKASGGNVNNEGEVLGFENNLALVRFRAMLPTLFECWKLEVIDADRGVGTGTGAAPAAEPAAGKKHDAEKPPLDLLDATALLEVGRVLEFGAKKYAPNNWRGGISRERLIAATLRHTLAAASGERNDPETGLSHLAHAMCELMFALHFEVKGTEVSDTRFEKG